MRCRECAAEAAAMARVCSRCGAPIGGQPPVVADTMLADMVVGAVSDTAGAVYAGFRRSPPRGASASAGRLRRCCLWLVRLRRGLRHGSGHFLFQYRRPRPVPRDARPVQRSVLAVVVVCSSWPNSRFLGGLSLGLGLGLRRVFTRSRRVAGFSGCSGGPAIHARPR